jgi:hypothetical protein
MEKTNFHLVHHTLLEANKFGTHQVHSSLREYLKLRLTKSNRLDACKEMKDSKAAVHFPTIP